MNNTYGLTFPNDDWKDAWSTRIILTIIYACFMVVNVYGIVKYILKAQVLIIAIMVSNLLAISSKYLFPL